MARATHSEKAAIELQRIGELTRQLRLALIDTEIIGEDILVSGRCLMELYHLEKRLLGEVAYPTKS